MVFIKKEDGSFLLTPKLKYTANNPNVCENCPVNLQKTRLTVISLEILKFHWRPSRAY